MKKSTISSLFVDVFFNFFSLQNAFPAVVLSLLVAPNKIIDNYFAGYRNYYPSPGQMIIFASAIGALHVLTVGTDIFGLAVLIQDNRVSSHIFIMALVTILFSITSYIIFISARYRFARHVISILYLSSVFFVINLVVSDIFFFLSGAEYDVIFYVCVVYFSVECYRFYITKKTFPRVEKPDIAYSNNSHHVGITVRYFITDRGY